MLTCQKSKIGKMITCFGWNRGCNSETQSAALLSVAVTFSHLFPGEQKRSGEGVPETTPKSFLLKPGQSGLRPPGFSTQPAARLAAFGFVQSSSVSSVSSNQSNDSNHSDPCRLFQRESRSRHTFHIN